MILYPYDPEWKRWFSDLKNVLESNITIKEIIIHHVGSTSITGMTAKPIIDIDIEIPDYSFLEAIESDLNRIGYINNGDQGIKDRLAFKRIDDEVPYSLPRRKWITHHLYICPSFSEELKKHLIFRDSLETYDSYKEEYARIKREIEIESNDDRKIYATIKETRAKSFVESVISRGRR